MPPIRWKLLLAASFLHSILICAPINAARHDSISMSDDGWKPIVGNQREPPYQDEIKFYRNPIQSSETVKAETLQTTTPSSSTHPTKPAPSAQTITVRNTNNFGQIIRVPAHSKHPISSQYYVLPNHGGHGPHIPLIQSRVISQNSKIVPQNQMVVIPAKRIIKPARIVGAHSNRDEIYLPAPPQGIYAFTNKGLNTIKTRDTPGLGIPSNAHFHGNSEFANHYTVFAPAENVFQYTPVPSFIHKPPPQQNEVHFPYQLQNDEFTRNLVPPPFKIYSEKPKAKPNPLKDSAVKESEGDISVKKAVVFVPEPILSQKPPPKPYEPKKFYKPTYQPDKAVEVQVTKEKLKVFHNTIPPNYNLDHYHTINRPNETPPPPPPHKYTYEVTEGNQWAETPPYQPQLRFPDIQRQPEKKAPEVELSKPFLPTPYKPETSPPTRATQSEAANVFTELSLKKKQNPDYFNVMEVSTHYPILGRPEIVEEGVPKEPEISNEITTLKEEEKKEQESETLPPTNVRPHRRRRPINHRTTTEEPATVSYERDDNRPKTPPRTRRPLRYRTTTPIPDEEVSTRPEVYRYNHRKRPGHRLKTRPTTTTTEKVEVETPVEPSGYGSEETQTEVVNSGGEYAKPIYTAMNRYRDHTTERLVINSEETDVRKPVSETEEENYPSSKAEDSAYESTYNGRRPSYESEEDVGHHYKTTTTEAVPTTEVEYSTARSTENYPPNAISIKEVYEEVTPQVAAATTTAETTTTSTTTTTETPSTTKSHRIRGRPNKYDVKNRPRFSVKEYRQRLNQYTSTTTEIQKLITTEPPTHTRSRYPSRVRRPNLPSQNDVSTESTRKQTDGVIDDAPVKAVNTRLRPFGRYRSTTEPTTTQKVSIRPHIFNNLRRPTPISLRKRIYNKQRNASTEATPVEDEGNQTEVVETTVEFSNQQPETSTEAKNLDSVEMEDETTDILKSDTFLKRVSDLTSSAKNEYDTPGLFKSVAPTSRRVPSYFTIATDDPILPIETVFANIKDKEKA